MSNDEHIKKGFGERMKARRLEKGLSQPQLSYIIEMNVGWINKVERGQGNPTITTAIKIARALDCQPGDLLNDL